MAAVAGGAGEGAAVGGGAARMIRIQIGLTSFFIGIPLLMAWTKLRLWDWLNNRTSE
jgi:hypothetical protein